MLKKQWNIYGEKIFYYTVFFVNIIPIIQRRTRKHKNSLYWWHFKFQIRYFLTRNVSLKNLWLRHIRSNSVDCFFSWTSLKVERGGGYKRWKKVPLFRNSWLWMENLMKSVRETGWGKNLVRHEERGDIFQLFGGKLGKSYKIFRVRYLTAVK